MFYLRVLEGLELLHRRHCLRRPVSLSIHPK